MKPGEDFRRVGDGVSGRQGGAVDQPDRQAQLPRRVKFGARSAAAGVFGDDQIAPVAAQQREVGGEVKGAARDFQRHLRQRQIPRRIDEAQKIIMLRLAGEIREMQAADGEEDPARRSAKPRHRSGEVWQAGPVIARAGCPGRAHQAQEWDPGQRRCRMGVPAHLRGKRMGRVDQMGDPMRPDPVGKAFAAAKASGSDRHRLGAWAFHPAGIRERGADPAIRDQSGKLACLGGAAKDEKGRVHG